MAQLSDAGQRIPEALIVDMDGVLYRSLALDGLAELARRSRAALLARPASSTRSPAARRMSEVSRPSDPGPATRAVSLGSTPARSVPVDGERSSVPGPAAAALVLRRLGARAVAVTCGTGDAFAAACSSRPPQHRCPSPDKEY
jgi:hypothetical protein